MQNCSLLDQLVVPSTSRHCKEAGTPPKAKGSQKDDDDDDEEEEMEDEDDTWPGPSSLVQESTEKQAEKHNYRIIQSLHSHSVH